MRARFLVPALICSVLACVDRTPTEPEASRQPQLDIEVQTSAQQVTFNFVGHPETWVVPSSVTSITVDVRGAQGGGNPSAPTPEGGKGGRVQTTLAVTPGEMLVIHVGGRGGDLSGPNTAGPGGFNGGGAGGIDNVDFNAPAGGGGGASDIRQGGDGLADRVVVAGGGGGAECCTGDSHGFGGDGGGTTGAAGGGPSFGSSPGGGGTQFEGGAGGAGCNGNGSSGSVGQGGVGGNGNRSGGGGGGGYYGGGGGGGCLYGSGGGGGSSYSAGQNTVHTQGYQTGAGQVVITYENQPPTATIKFQSPLTPIGFNNGYSAFNRVPRGNASRRHHTGIDLTGPIHKVVRAAGDGCVMYVIGLAPAVGGDETIAIWQDHDSDEEFDDGEETPRHDGTKPDKTGRKSMDNHGLGITVMIKHSNGVYTLYGHLDAITAQINERVLTALADPKKAATGDAGCTALGEAAGLYVPKGEPIGLLGFSEDEIRQLKNVHLHFEVKEHPLLGNPSDASVYPDGLYFGYTPDLPTSYGYEDPFARIYPHGSGNALSPPRVVRVISTENPVGSDPNTVSGGKEALTCTVQDSPKRGIRIYAGPGVNYSVLGWTGKEQRFVVDRVIVSTTVGDVVSNRTWYRIGLPNHVGPVHGWIAKTKSDLSTPLVEELADGVTVATVNVNSEVLRREAGGSAVSVRAPIGAVHSWRGQQYVVRSYATGWYEIYIPLVFYTDPQKTTSCAPPTDNAVGDVATAWLSTTALAIQIQ